MFLIKIFVRILATTAAPMWLTMRVASGAPPRWTKKGNTLHTVDTLVTVSLPVDIKTTSNQTSPAHNLYFILFFSMSVESLHWELSGGHHNYLTFNLIAQIALQRWDRCWWLYSERDRCANTEQCVDQNQCQDFQDRKEELSTLRRHNPQYSEILRELQAKVSHGCWVRCWRECFNV